MKSIFYKINKEVSKKINIKKINDIFNKIFVFSHSVFSFICIWSIFKLLVCYKSYNFLSIPYFFLLIFSFITILYNIFYSFIKKMNIEKKFLLLSIPFGLAFVFLQPPNFKPDEPHHLFRTIDIANGQLMPLKDDNHLSKIFVPRVAIELNGLYINNLSKVDEYLDLKADYSDTCLVSSTAASYSPVSYIFSTSGILIGKMLSLSWIWTFVLARLFNFIVYLIVGFYAIKIMPFCKLLVFTLLLNPMVLHQATAISGDVLLNSISIIYLAYLLHLKYKKISITSTNIILLFLMLVTIILIKIAYLPLVLLLYLLKKNIYKYFLKNKKGIYVFIISTLIFVLAIVIHEKNNYYINEEIFINPLVDSTFQISNIIKNPLNYIVVLFNTFMEYSEFYMTSFAGKYLAWVDIANNSIVSFLYLCLLFFSPFISQAKVNIKLDKIDKIIMMIAFAATVAFMFTGIYIIWNSVGNSVINGIQGRYFIPIIMLLIIPLYNNKNVLIFKNSQKIYTFLLSFINAIMLINLIKHYV